MTCLKPIRAWKNNRADLTMPPNLYYKNKKISFKEKKDWIEIQIPCGHCLGCRLDHANEWATRMTLESKLWKNNCFITLTYDDKHLPNNKNLNEKDVQDFMKRLRFHEHGIETWTNPITGKFETPIRYFYCGEYGGKLGRPHYHIAIFNWSPTDLKNYKPNKTGQMIYKSKKIYEIWGNGFAPVEQLNYKTACYIARYVQKKSGIAAEKLKLTGKFEIEEKIDERNGNKFEHLINKREKINKKQTHRPEFMRCSQGLGLKYWEENKEIIKRNQAILIKVDNELKIKKIPRYFEKKWEKENAEEFYRYKYEKEKKGKEQKNEILKKVSTNKDYAVDEFKYDNYLNSKEINTKQRGSRLIRNGFV